MAQKMAIFVSNREKRLWVFAALIVVAIYSTLGLARKLAGWMRNQELLGAAFVTLLILVLVSITWIAVRQRPEVRETGAWIGVVTAYLFVLMRMAIPEERTHLIEYGIVGALVYAALLERATHSDRVRLPALQAILITALLGAVDEGIQALLPNRVFDPRDLLFNALAGLMAVTAVAVIRWARRPGPTPAA